MAPRRTLAGLTLAFILGIMLAVNLNFELKLLVFFLGAGTLIIIALAGYFLAWRNNRQVIFFLFLTLGFIFTRLSLMEINPNLLTFAGHWVTVRGVVSQEADVRIDRIYYYLDVRQISLGPQKKKIEGKVLVRVPVPAPVYGYGDLLAVHGVLIQPEEPGNPGQFNYRAYLGRQKINVVLMVKDPKNIKRLGKERGNPFIYAVLTLKEKLVEINQKTLSPEKAALVNGIVFGTQGQIERETWDLFSQTGIVHILSVSGLHVGLVVAGILALLRILRLAPVYTAPVTTFGLLFYALLCGMGPAVTRATFMALLLLWAYHLNRAYDWPTTLAVAAFLSLLWRPLSLYDLGFQLSFAATWGILYLGPLLKQFLNRFSTWPKGIRDTIWVTLAAQLGTLPLVAWYYNLLQPVSMLANIMAAPLTGLILALGAVASLLGLISLPLAGLINAGTSFVIELFISLTSFIRLIPGGIIYVATPPLYLILAWYPFLFGAVNLLSSKRKNKIKEKIRDELKVKNKRIIYLVSFIFILIILGGTLISAKNKDKELTVHFIDVGQGDSILIQTPQGKNMLLDTGGWREEFIREDGAGNKVVVPYLRRLGIRKIDVLVLTHPDEDHAGGAKAVLENFPVKLMVVSPVGLEPDKEATKLVRPEYLSLLNWAIQKKIVLKVAKAGAFLPLDPALTIKILNPPISPLKGTRSDSNNASVMISLSYGKQRFLFTGDCDVEGQKWLLAHKRPYLRAQVLKVPHHGSRYFEADFLKAVNPKIAVISVGARNNFGHPDQVTLDLLARRKIFIYRTDLDGAIILTTDGANIWLKTGRLKKEAA
ncbi:MAG: DNA internalization-related competence protein ComEC/Rec2 [Peptococcaceae bacterium]